MQQILYFISIFWWTGSASRGKNTCFFNGKFWKAKNHVFLSHFLTPKTALFRDPPLFYRTSTKETLPPPCGWWRGGGGGGVAGWRAGWVGWVGWAGWVGWLGWLVGLAGWLVGRQRMVIGFDWILYILGNAWFEVWIFWTLYNLWFELLIVYIFDKLWFEVLDVIHLRSFTFWSIWFYTVCN